MKNIVIIICILSAILLMSACNTVRPAYTYKSCIKNNGICKTYQSSNPVRRDMVRKYYKSN